MSRATTDFVKIMKEQIRNYQSEMDISETGIVLSFADGIARIYGLENCFTNELILFEHGSIGMAMNLEEDSVAVVLLDHAQTVQEDERVFRSKQALSVPVGESLLGRVVDALGREIDGQGEIERLIEYPIERQATDILDRQGVHLPLETGIKAIDSMIPIGKGQRELIIGDRQTGKTSLAVDAILNQKNSSVICIYVAIGQKQSTVMEIEQQFKQADIMNQCIIVSASASMPAALQYIAPYSACSMAEYFMENGQDVLIVYDDLSKHASAYRELSLLLERSPGREAYPGDVFYLHSRLLERAASLSEELGGGTLTALPIVETQAGDVSAYIPTNIISITDGQIFLESELFHAGIIPAVNAGISVSRVGGSAQIKAMKSVSAALKLAYSQYRELQTFAQFGNDLDEDTQMRLEQGRRIVEVLKQPQASPVSMEKQVAIIYAVLNQYLADIPLDAVQDFEQGLYDYLDQEATEWLNEIRSNTPLDSEHESQLQQYLSVYHKLFQDRLSLMDGEQ